MFLAGNASREEKLGMGEKDVNAEAGAAHGESGRNVCQCEGAAGKGTGGKGKKKKAQVSPNGFGVVVQGRVGKKNQNPPERNGS